MTDSGHRGSIKVLKVRVDPSIHKRLHIARLMTGRPIAHIVQEALALYLRRHGAPDVREAVPALEA